MSETKINKNRLANTFVETINGQTPDANGNVFVTNVESANQLNSPDSINDYGDFIFRTSAGTKSISADPNTFLGQATLLSLQGNIENPRRSLDNIDKQYNAAARVFASVDATTFGTAVNHVSNEAYTFNFDGTNWTLQGETPVTITPENLTTVYGITLTGDNAINGDSCVINYTYDDSGEEPVEYATATYNEETRISVVVVEDTFASKVNNVVGSYNFVYSGDRWFINDISFTTSELNTQYGITIIEAGTEASPVVAAPVSGDSLTVTYNGDMKVATPTSFVTSSFNQFNPANVLPNSTINENGEIVESVGSSVAYIHAVGGLQNAHGSRHGDYTIYDSNGTLVRIGFSTVNNATTVKLNDTTPGQRVIVNDNSGSTTTQWITFDQTGYIYVALTNTAKLCVHPEWSGYNDDKYQDYIAPVTWADNTPVDGKRTKPSIINIPTTGYLEDDTTHQSIPLPCANYLARIGLVYDEILFKEHKYINRIGYKEYSVANLLEVEAMGVDYVYDSNGIYYVMEAPQTYIINYNIVDGNVVLDVNESGQYMVCDFGTEEFIYASGKPQVALLGNFLYGNNLVDKLRTDVLTKSAQSLSQDQKEQIWQNIGALPLYNYAKTVTPGSISTVELEDVYTLYELKPNQNTNVKFDISELTKTNDAWTTFYLFVDLRTDNNESYSVTFEYDDNGNDTGKIQWGNTSPTITANCCYLFSFTKPKGSSIFVGNQCYTWME